MILSFRCASMHRLGTMGVATAVHPCACLSGTRRRVVAPRPHGELHSTRGRRLTVGMQFSLSYDAMKELQPAHRGRLPIDQQSER